MNKILQFLATWILPVAERPVLNALAGGLSDFLDKAYEKHPKAVKQMVSALYSFIDVVAEDVILDTTNEYDDRAVAELKKELEEFAARKEFELSNLDTD